jgi:hypothetical protein
MRLVNTPRYIKRSRSPSMMEKIAIVASPASSKLDHRSWLSPDKSEEVDANVTRSVMRDIWRAETMDRGLLLSDNRPVNSSFDYRNRKQTLVRRGMSATAPPVERDCSA